MPLWTAERQQLAAEVVLVTGVVMMMTVVAAAAEVLEVGAIPRKVQEEEEEEMEAEGAGAVKQSACAATSGHCLAGCRNWANVCRSRP